MVGRWWLLCVLLLLMLPMLLPPALAAAPMPIVSYGGFGAQPDSISAQSGVASFVHDRVAYVAELAPLGDGRPEPLVGPAAGKAWRVAAENGIAVVTRTTGGGFYVYTTRPAVTLLTGGSIIAASPDWHYDSTYGRPTPYGRFGGYVAMAGDQAILSTQHLFGASFLEVYEFSATARATHVQTIALPAPLPHWTNNELRPIQVHRDHMVVSALHTVLHYVRSEGVWTLESSFATPDTATPRADVGDDALGFTRLVYTPDGRNAYVAHIDNPLENRAVLPMLGFPITSLAIDDGIVALTEGDGWLGRGLGIFAERDGQWEQSHRPQYASLGRFYGYTNVDVSDGNVMVSGYDLGAFEPRFWLDLFVVPEADLAPPDRPVPRVWEPKYNAPEPDLTPVLCLNFLSVLHFAADC